MNAALVKSLTAFAMCIALAVLSAQLSIGNTFDRWGSDQSSVWPISGRAVEYRLSEYTRAHALDGFDGDYLQEASLLEASEYVLSQEPLSFPAMRTLAINQSGTPEDATSARAMNAIDDVYKRDRLVNLWLLENSLRASNLKAALDQMDQFLRVLGDQRGSILTFMSRVVLDEELREPLREILLQRPVWERDFWYAVSRDPQALSAALSLRHSLLEAGMPSDLALESELIYRGLEQGAFASAAEIYGEVSRQSDLYSLRDPNFANQPVYPPFDWKLENVDGVSASIDSISRQLRVYTAPSTRGSAASQLVRLAPGQYGATIHYGLAIEREDARPTLELQCVSDDGNITSDQLVSSEGQSSFSFVNDGCEWAMFQIVLPFTLTSADFVIDRVSLDRAI